jgi:hypothetical protein
MPLWAECFSPRRQREEAGPYVWGSHSMRIGCQATAVRTASAVAATEQYNFSGLRSLYEICAKPYSSKPARIARHLIYRHFVYLMELSRVYWGTQWRCKSVGHCLALSVRFFVLAPRAAREIGGQGKTTCFSWRSSQLKRLITRGGVARRQSLIGLVHRGRGRQSC